MDAPVERQISLDFELDLIIHGFIANSNTIENPQSWVRLGLRV
jgi:hypothetical protein